MSAKYWVLFTDQVDESEQVEPVPTTNHIKLIHKPAMTKIRQKWKRRTDKRAAKQMEIMAETRQLIERGGISQAEWQHALQQIKQGKRPSAVYDSGATSNCGRTCDPFLPTSNKSNKVFNIPNGAQMAATKEAKLKLPVREPAKTVHILPQLEHNSLLSASKFADAGYVSILTPTDLLIIEGDEILHKLEKDAILRGWRDPASGLWRVPLESPSHKDEHVLLAKEVEEAISNVYELPSTNQIVR